MVLCVLSSILSTITPMDKNKSLILNNVDWFKGFWSVFFFFFLNHLTIQLRLLGILVQPSCEAPPQKHLFLAFYHLTIAESCRVFICVGWKVEANADGFNSIQKEKGKSLANDRLAQDIRPDAAAVLSESGWQCHMWIATKASLKIKWEGKHRGAFVTHYL